MKVLFWFCNLKKSSPKLQEIQMLKIPRAAWKVWSKTLEGYVNPLLFNSLMPTVSNKIHWIITSKQLFCFTISLCTPKKAIFTDMTRNLNLLWQDKVNILMLVGIFTLSCHKTLSHYKRNYHVVVALEQGFLTGGKFTPWG